MKFAALLTLSIAALLCLSLMPTPNADAQTFVYSDGCNGSQSFASPYGASDCATSSYSYASPSCSGGGYAPPVTPPPGGGYQENPGVYYAPQTYAAPQQINPSFNYQPRYQTTNYSILPPIEFRFGVVPGPAMPTNRGYYQPAYRPSYYPASQYRPRYCDPRTGICY